MRTRVTLFCVFSFLLLFSSCCCVGGIGSDWTRYKNEFEKSYAIQTPAHVNVKNIDGFVHVNSWDKNEVLVKGTVSLRAENEKEALKRMKEIDVIITHEDNSLNVRVERKKHVGFAQLFRFSTDWKVDLEISVPKDCNLAVSSVDGAVRTSGLKGTHKLSTVDGAIEVRDMEGRIGCRTVDGSCTLSNVRGNVDVSTTDGSIEVEGVITGLEATTVDGSMRVNAFEGSSVEEKWNLSGVSGSIRLGVPESLSADLEATTVDGHVSIDIPALVNRMSERKVSVRLGKGGNPISISTTDGSISVERTNSKKEEV